MKDIPALLRELTRESEALKIKLAQLEAKQAVKQ